MNKKHVWLVKKIVLEKKKKKKRGLEIGKKKKRGTSVVCAVCVTLIRGVKC